MAADPLDEAGAGKPGSPGTAWVRFSRYASVAVIAVGVTVLAGWLFEVEALKSVLPGRVAMNPMTALAFALAGTALLLETRPTTPAWLTYLLALPVATLSLAKAASYGFDVQLGIDRLLFPAALGDNRMAPNTAFCMGAVALALLLLRRRPALAQALALIVGVFALGALIGYAYAATALYGIGPFIPMALNTAGCFLILAAGILTQQPRRGLTKIATSKRRGGYLVRRLLPSALVVPFLLGWWVLKGQTAGYYGVEFGMALLAAATILTFAGIVLATGLALNRADRRQEQAEADLHRERHLLHALMNNLPDSIFFKDAAGRFTRVNRAHAAYLGLRDPAAVIGKTDFDFFTCDCAAPAAAEEQEVMRTAVPITGKEEEQVRSDGRRSWSATTKLALRDPAGMIVGTFGISRDITEQKRLADSMAHREKLASIGLLSAGIAHEINNPLAFVGNNVVVLERDCGALLKFALAADEALGDCSTFAPEPRERLQQLRATCDLGYLRENLERMLARTRDGVERVARIIHSLRSLARSDRPKPEEASLPSLLESSLEVLRGRLQRSGIALTVDLDGAPRVRCVPTQMTQVFLNLLTNAVQALETSGKSGAAIAIRGRRDGDEAVVEVADNGPGIAAANLPRIFDPFFTTKPVGEGTGLGLSISHTIIESHGGHLEVRSRPGEGATFTIRLPLGRR